MIEMPNVELDALTLAAPTKRTRWLSGRRDVL